MPTAYCKGLDNFMDNLPQNADGSLAAWAWPGSYPLYYLTRDGLVVCPKCANSETSDPVIAADVYWEGEPLECQDCAALIESAYGVPE